MNLLIILVHVIASIALIAIVLLQTGKGAEMGAAFGGASQTLFGGSGGSSFMSKLTTGAAVVFMITCLLLSYKPTGSSRSVMHDIPVPEQSQSAPVLPEARPVQPDAAPQKAPAPSSSAQPAPQQKAPDKK
jgi:preprotein translocase subunit SecG